MLTVPFKRNHYGFVRDLLPDLTNALALSLAGLKGAALISFSRPLLCAASFPHAVVRIAPLSNELAALRLRLDQPSVFFRPGALH
jgi:hypothetical protein